MNKQLIFKIFLTLLTIPYLKYVWTSDFDIKQTFKKKVKQLNPAKDLFETREKNSIYKEGVKVGDIIGADLNEKDGTFLFEAINYDNTKINLNNISDPLTFRSYEIKIENINEMSIYPPKIVGAKGKILKKGI